MIDLGPLDRWVRFQRKSTTRDTTTNEEKVSWVKHCDTWATVLDSLASQSERVEQRVRLENRTAVVRMRWLPAITSEMRLLMLDRDNRVLNIVSIAEIGRREGLEFSVQTYSTEGQGA